MIIDVQKLKRPKEITLNKSVKWADEASSHTLEGEIISLEGTIIVSRHKKGVNAEINVAVEVETTCVRCLDPVLLKIEASELLYYEPYQEEITSDNLGLSEQDLDVGYFEGTSLDLSQVLSEALALNMPPRIICDLDEVSRKLPGDCKIDVENIEDVVDPRFSVLKGLNLDS